MENHIDTLVIINGKLGLRTISLERKRGNCIDESFLIKKGMYLFISKGIAFRHLKNFALQQEMQAFPSN